MMCTERKINQLKDVVENSRYLVCICGLGMQAEAGSTDFEDSDVSYEIERRYGYAFEEIFNTAFYSTRKEMFFKFYRQEFIQKEVYPNEAYKTLGWMEQNGKLRAVITPGVYSLPQKGGCTHVVELHGSISKNECPHCKKEYTKEFIKDTQKVPLCTECGAVIRPGVFLFGEMVDNSVITKAMEEVGRADVLLICGTNLNDAICMNCIQYFHGDKVVIVNSTPHFTDEKANLVIYNEVKNVLPKLMQRSSAGLK